jgi:ATP-dependent Clp protease protease subunit
MNYIKPPIHTICVGFAMGMAAMLLSAGTKGFRASLPNASIVLHQTQGMRVVKQRTSKFGQRSSGE